MTDRPRGLGQSGDEPHAGHHVEGDLDGVAGVVRSAFDALAAPDHGTPGGWAARGLIQEWAGPVVFLVHPTTHRAAGTDGDWFGDPGDLDVRAGVEEKVRAQGRAFGGELWAPHYRQASTRAFAERSGVGEEAYDLAYDDVAAAFSEFLVQESGQDPRRGSAHRPLVLVGHSQGARHVQRLLDEFFDHPGLAERLVAAYVIGVAVADDAPSLSCFPLASSPDDHGVLVAYQARLAEGDSPMEGHGLCIAADALGAGSTRGVANDRGYLTLSGERAAAWREQALPDGRLHAVEIEVLGDVLAADVRRRTRTWRSTRADAVAAEGDCDAALNVGDLPAVDGTDEVPVVLLHKLGGWGAEWDDVAHRLARRRRVVVLDLPGHGGSVRAGHAPWVQWPAQSAAEVLAALEALGFERFHLIGASLGGVVASHLAAQWPDRVASLALIATSATPALSARRTHEIDRSLSASFTAGWLPLPGHHARAATTSHQVRSDLDASRARAGRWVRASERGVGLAGMEPVLGRLRVPVLCLDGEHAPYRRYAGRVEELIDDVRFVVIPDAGAFVHQEVPEAVVGEWERFAGRTSLDAGGK